MQDDILQVQQVSPRVITVTYFGNEGEYDVTEEFKTVSQCSNRMDEYTVSDCFIYNPK